MIDDVEIKKRRILTENSMIFLKTSVLRFAAQRDKCIAVSDGILLAKAARPSEIDLSHLPLFSVHTATLRPEACLSGRAATHQRIGRKHKHQVKICYKHIFLPVCG
ncbi:hypothetical protein LVJ83_13210 [Uruburuella testudinis]|uniref:Uncharacterized protein n=1 Tax=Uruburuella testudinis TaxID=1282863 RepID=A0ABY4DS31_9NEIS|nr:hypothetical protein [Uruburuella testudinis]UOO81843.1 hypothetical protein LVJ83_13210 [Uruburuella testudinis]